MELLACDDPHQVLVERGVVVWRTWKLARRGHELPLLDEILSGLLRAEHLLWAMSDPGLSGIAQNQLWDSID